MTSKRTAPNQFHHNATLHSSPPVRPHSPQLRLRARAQRISDERHDWRRKDHLSDTRVPERTRRGSFTLGKSTRSTKPALSQPEATSCSTITDSATPTCSPSVVDSRSSLDQPPTAPPATMYHPHHHSFNAQPIPHLTSPSFENSSNANAPANNATTTSQQMQAVPQRPTFVQFSGVPEYQSYVQTQSHSLPNSHSQKVSRVPPASLAPAYNSSYNSAHNSVFDQPHKEEQHHLEEDEEQKQKQQEYEVLLNKLSQPGLQKWITPAIVKHGYVVMAIVSEGSFGTVLKATRQKDDHTVALKAVPKNRLSEKEFDTIRKQAEALRAITHRYIVKFHHDFEDDQYFYHVFEYLHGGDLYDRLECRGKPFSEAQVLFLARQILYSVSYLHARRAAHRDIKLENFVFETSPTDERQVMKLIDFDLLIVRHRDSTRTETCSDMCGTILYISPEIAAGREHVPEESDMWACGVMLYVLLSYQMPFQGATGRQILRAVRSMEPYFAPAVWANVSVGTKSLVKDLLNKNAAERPTAEQALDRVKTIQMQARQPVSSSRLRALTRGLRSVSLNLWDPAGHLVRRGGGRCDTDPRTSVGSGRGEVPTDSSETGGGEWPAPAGGRITEWRSERTGTGLTTRRKRGERPASGQARRARSHVPDDAVIGVSPSSSLRSTGGAPDAEGTEGRHVAFEEMSSVTGKVSVEESMRRVNARYDGRECLTSPALGGMLGGPRGHGPPPPVQTAGLGAQQASRTQTGQANGHMGANGFGLRGGPHMRNSSSRNLVGGIVVDVDGGDGFATDGSSGVLGNRKRAGDGAPIDGDNGILRASRRFRKHGHGFGARLRQWIHKG